MLDDLGAQQTSPWADEKIFQLLNYRYNEMLPVLITTNHLSNVDERVASRLMDRAKDYRPNTKPA